MQTTTLPGRQWCHEKSRTGDPPRNKNDPTDRARSAAWHVGGSFHGVVWLEPHAADHRHGRTRGDHLRTVVRMGRGGSGVGNLVGAVFMALHAAQGPTLGVPQMVQTRGQFGSLGSLLVVGIVIIMYLGFLSSNLVLGGEAVTSIAPGLSDTPGIALVGVLSVIAAIFGYDLIHAYARVMSYLAGSVLLITFVWIIWVHGLPSNFLSRNALSMSGLLGTISAAALWQIAYAPYVSDYSRYMPPDTGARSAFWASYWGCTLLSITHKFKG